MQIWGGFVPTSPARRCVWILGEVERTKAINFHGCHGLYRFSTPCLAKFPIQHSKAFGKNKELRQHVRPGEILSGEVSARLRACPELAHWGLPAPRHLQGAHGA